MMVALQAPSKYFAPAVLDQQTIEILQQDRDRNYNLLHTND